MSAALTTNVDQRLLRTTKFPPEFNTKVDMQKVNVPVIKKWVADEIARILQSDDDVVTELVFNIIESARYPNIKELQISLTGFLDKDAPAFCRALWKLCISAQSNPQGVPKELLEAKKQELEQERLEEEKAREEARKRMETERAREREVERIRDRERSSRGRSGRSDRDFDRRPPHRASRSPPRTRIRDDRYRGPPPSRGGDIYAPRDRDEPRRRRRSPSYGRSPSRSPSPPPRRRRRNTSSERSATPPRKDRKHSRSRSRSRDRASGRKRDRFSRGDGRRRSRSPAYRRSSRSPRRHRRRRSPSLSDGSRSPPPKRTRRSPSSSRSPPPRRRARDSSPMSRSPPRRHEKRPELADNDLMSRPDRRNDRHHKDARRLNREASTQSETAIASADIRAPTEVSKSEKKGTKSDESLFYANRDPVLSSKPSIPGTSAVNKPKAKLDQNQLREKLLKAKLMARRDQQRRDSLTGT